MAIEQQGTAETVDQQGDLFRDGPVIGAVRLVEPLVELSGCDGFPPEEPVMRSARRYDTQAATRPCRQPLAPPAFDDRRVDLMFASDGVSCTIEIPLEQV